LSNDDRAVFLVAFLFPLPFPTSFACGLLRFCSVFCLRNVDQIFVFGQQNQLVVRGIYSIEMLSRPRSTVIAEMAAPHCDRRWCLKHSVSAAGYSLHLQTAQFVDLNASFGRSGAWPSREPMVTWHVMATYFSWLAIDCAGHPRRGGCCAGSVHAVAAKFMLGEKRLWTATDESR
jgi:hypothetical protein